MQRHADEPQWAPLRDQDISLRGAYRTRPVDELEECTWAAEDDPKALVTEHVRLASVSSQQPTRIVWTNTSQFAVRILWVDFEGNEIAYSILEPGKSKRYRTFTTHAWICREVESGVRMLCNGRTACIGRDGEQKVSVTAPPQLIWTTETHTLFPTECQQRTRALLLAHNCLEKAVTYSSGRSAACPPSPARAPPASPRRLPMLKVSSGAADASPMTPRTMVAVCPASPRAAPLTPRRLPAVAEPEGMPSFTEPKAAPLPAAIDFNGPIDGDSMTRGCGSAGAGPSCVAPRMMVCTALPADAPAGARSNGGIIRSLLHAVKHSLFCSCNSEPATPLAPGDMAAFLPAVPESAPLAAGAALTRTVSAAAAFVTAANAAAEPAASWPPRGAHLGLLPYGIVMRIVELANTEQYFVRQSLYMPALGRADISPALLDGPPPAPAPAGEEQAGGVQAQQ